MYFGVLCNQVVDLNVENFAEIVRKIVLHNIHVAMHRDS